jgi:hypothetical protein
VGAVLRHRPFRLARKPEIEMTLLDRLEDAEDSARLDNIARREQEVGKEAGAQIIYRSNWSTAS